MTQTQRQVHEAQRLLSGGEPNRAERLLRALLSDAPDDIEAQYSLAVAQRHQHHWDAALVTLSAIVRSRPEFGRAHQECGYNHIAKRAFANAQAAFERATGFDLALVNSWKCLAKLYAEQGDEARLAAVREHLAFLDGLPAELLPVISYISEDRLREAEALCKQFLRTNQTHVEGMRLLAEIATRNKIYEDAEFLLESCVEFDPGHRAAGTQYVNLLLKVQKFSKALVAAERLLDRFPQDADLIRPLYAAACAGAGRNEAAAEGYGIMMRQQPDNPFHPVLLGHVYKSDGEFDRAVAMYRQAYGIKGDYGDAWWSLANTKSYRFTDDELSRMAAMERDPGTGAVDRIQLCFALGKAHEDRGEHERAFACYARGNALKQPTVHHSPRHLQVRVDSQIEVCTPELFAARPAVGLPAPDPIFIVGLPRAGSTLLEQILSSHSQVDGTMELHNVLNLAKRLRGRGGEGEDEGQPRYPKILAELEDSYFRRFGKQFIDDTRAYRGTAPFFIDKMPNNFFHIGLIKLILPRARVIDARRHPMACCFSGFKQLFGEGQDFSYGLREIGNYYRQYVKLMDHWDRVLPGFVLRVEYEDVVETLEDQVRRLLDFCELTFEPACLEYHRTRRSVRTPSAAQVRQPIYTSGLEQWRNYEPWLDPLKDALGPEVLARYPIDA
ncbi:sulfotransferase [Candidatus Rariloculus sp.]|uniref:tetratricopeptide repeat-containing sulfotransferase family protein n=1 Tax=Candidatus Rariloculus sp. TaxID=3101265 RepID=UPI003D13A32F